MFGVAAEVSKEILSKLFRILMAELTISAKLAIAKASKIAKSTEFNVILSTATATSIGLLMI